MEREWTQGKVKKQGYELVFKGTTRDTVFTGVEGHQRSDPRRFQGNKWLQQLLFFFRGLKGYSGVGIYSKLEPETVERSFGDGRFEDEGRILKADYGDFVLFNVYFPSGASSEEDLLHKFDFYEHFLMNMQKLAEDDVKVLVCGDFNIAHREIDLVNPKAASKSAGFLPEERAFLDRLVEYGYSDAFRMFNEDSANYTWWSYGHGCREKNLGMRLDYFFAGEGLKCSIESAYLRHDVNGSDHCPIGMDIQIP